MTETTTMELTPGELEIIQRRREKAAEEKAKMAFQYRAMKTAAAFAGWSMESGEGLTFSTFVNTFEYQDDDCREMYEAVKRIYAASYPQ